MKKILALVLAFAMLAAVLAGCASSTDTKNDTPQTQQPAAEQSAQQPAEEETAAEESNKDKKMVIGMACINLSDAGLVLIKKGADLAAEDYNCELVWKACDGSIDTQIDQIRGFV